MLEKNSTFREGQYDKLIQGTQRILELFKDIQQYLPPFRMTISPHDGPNRMSDYGVKQTALQAAASKTCELLLDNDDSELYLLQQISAKLHCQRHII